MSASSYLGDSWEPTRTVLVGLASSTTTGLVSLVEMKVGTWLGLPGSWRHSTVVARSGLRSTEFVVVVARLNYSRLLE